MLMVFLSHTKHHFEGPAPELYWVVLSVTRIATPAFLLLSGFVVRHLLSTDRDGRAGITLVDRALFLLIVAHALIGVDSLLDMSATRWFFDRTMITDAIGIALLFAVLLRRRSTTTLLVSGATIFVLSWIAASVLQFNQPWSQWLAAVTVQWRGSTNPDIDVPVIGYLGVFLMGMALHSHLERPLMRSEYERIARRLLFYGVIGVSAALLGTLAWHFSKEFVEGLLGGETTGALVREFLDPRGKRPPSPGYLAFYGGLSLIVLATFFRGKPAALVQPTVRTTAVIGRASLMCFIVQDWILLALPRVFGLEDIQSVPFWLAYLMVATAVIFTLAFLWGRARGNRFLTVGLKALARWRQASAQARAVAKPLNSPKHLF